MPSTWQKLAFGYWRLPQRLALGLWRALCKSTWAVPTNMRQQILFYDATLIGGATQFLFNTCTPDAMVGVIETLVQEHRLSRKEANTMEECILQRVDATGMWR